jgi:hypothetical protein
LIIFSKSIVQFVAISIVLVLASVTNSQGQLNVTTYHNDNARTGQNLQETVLTPQNVGSTTFGKLFSYRVDGNVYAQPLYLQNVDIPQRGVHNVVYVVTEHDSVYAFDGDSNAGANIQPLWKRSFVNPARGVRAVSSKDVDCRNPPEIGITGTPVIDTSTGTIYMVTITKENSRFVQRLHALDVRTGTEKLGGPVVITATVPGDGDGSSNGFVTFDPLRQGQRPGLLLQNGLVYIGWASYCDISPYHGWIMAYDAKSLNQVAVWNTTPNGGQGGVWQSGGGLAGDADFNIYFATGNGTFDGDTDFGDSILKLSQTNDGTFTVADYFTPYDQASLNISDADLGSGGVLLFPDQPEGSLYQHLLVEAGKGGTLYLINRDEMGHFHVGDDSQIVQSIPRAASGGMYGSFAWWNNNLYLAGNDDNLKAFSFDVASGKLFPSPTSQTSIVFDYPPPTPSISANGNSNAILWIIQNDYVKHRVVLRAYDANNLSRELYNSNEESDRDLPVHFSVPTVVNGKVYVGAASNLIVYGLLL